MRGVAALALLSLGAGCASTSDDDASGAAAAFSTVKTFTTRGTGYFPDASAMEGGFVDREGKPLHTLQQFVAGSAPYVSVAMDTTTFAYGTRLRIQELNAEFGKEIIIRVVDTGGAFKGKGLTRMDVCTANRTASLNPVINATLHVEVVDESAGAAPPTPATDAGTAGNDDGAPTPTTSPPTT